MLESGMKAPEFMLPDKDGNTVSLSDFLGKKVVLYFYPKDNTPGCTRQACAFAAAYEGFKAREVVVIGISKDSVASHLKFAQKHNLPFILLYYFIVVFAVITISIHVICLAFLYFIFWFKNANVKFNFLTYK